MKYDLVLTVLNYAIGLILLISIIFFLINLILLIAKRKDKSLQNKYVRRLIITSIILALDIFIVFLANFLNL
jgi:hypothetical protein